MSAKNIALLLGDIRDVYSNEVVKGAMQAAKENGSNLLIVPGRYFQAGEEYLLGEHEYQYQTLFTYFTKNNVDMVILCAGSVGYVSDCDGRNSLDLFRKRIGNIPLITISGDAPGVPNVRYDNFSGIHKGITYMLKNQHCKKIAMVGGEKENPDTKERVYAYKNAIVSLGGTVDEELIVYGDFTERSEPLIYDFLKAHPDVDGVVFANDGMAIAGYRSAKKLGRVVGKDIAFLGFDNIEQDNYMDPPLASVDADAYGLGYAAVMESLHYLHTRRAADHIIPSRFVIRSSIILHGEQELVKQSLGYGIDKYTNFDDLAKSSFDYFYDARNGDLDRDELFEYFGKFMSDLSAVIFAEDITTEQVEELRLSYKRLFEEDENGSINIGKFMYFLEVMEQAMLDHSQNETKQKHIVRISSFAYKYLSYVISLRESNTANRLNNARHEINRISADLIGLQNVSDKTYASVLSKFGRFGVKHCFLYLYDKPIRHEISDEFIPDEALYLKAALNDGELYSPSKEEQKIPISDIFSFAFSESGEFGYLIMLNLFIRDMIYGVILCDIPYEIFDYHESINSQMNSAIGVISLLQEAEEKD